MSPTLPYLVRLADRLTTSLEALPPATRERHRQFLLAQQEPEGGFRGREPGSDLYYTGFAVRGLAILGGLEAVTWAPLARYLTEQSRRSLTVIDLNSWLYSCLVVQASGGPDVLAECLPDWPDRLAEMLESFRTQDGGYAKTHEGAAGSVYHSFLVLLCYELIGRPLPHPRKLVQFLFDRQRDDGGFVEIAPMKRSGTNPTAAAAAILQICGHMDEQARVDVLSFLREVRSSEGGFQANTRIPFADGLSTFTALLTAHDLNLPELIPQAETRRFIASLELPGGGFRGASWDQVADAEYTFYSLGNLALLGGPFA